VTRVLAISGRHRDAAAALAVDGRLVAAVAEEAFARIPRVGYTLTGGLPAAAVRACLDAAGCAPEDIDEVTVVAAENGLEDAGPPVPGLPSRAVVTAVDALAADARQAALAGPDVRRVVIASARPAAFVTFDAELGRMTASARIEGARHLAEAAAAMGALVGLDGRDPVAALDRLGVGADASQADGLAGVLSCDGDRFTADLDVLRARVGAIAGDLGAAIRDPRSFNQRAQQLRRELAASFISRLAAVLAEAARHASGGCDWPQVAFGGDLLASPRLRAELRRLTGNGLAMAAVPEGSGRALGAALAGRPAAPLAGLALGPAFSDADIKGTLDNCRLDYVYEPDQTRLHHRVSRMLEQGKVVGWFQGALGFGPRTLGTRSILCDPSNRYARQNMNEYLRQQPIDEPLPLVVAPSMAGTCLTEPCAPLAQDDGLVREEWRDKLVSAVAGRQAVRLHGVTPAQAPELCDLLEYHHGRTGVPGLIETNLAGPGETTACTPRDAVRTVYSSAIDALVIGRFVLMKDHWLLRSHGD
jgi:carbamoyltransferase